MIQGYTLPIRYDEKYGAIYDANNKEVFCPIGDSANDIVHACNVHDDLVNALIECRELAAKGSKFAGGLTRDVIDAGLHDIDKVIAKARGK